MDPKNASTKRDAGVAPLSSNRSLIREPHRRDREQLISPLQGYAGSWASQWILEGQTEGDTAVLEVKQSRLAQPGFHETNFRPYDFHTSMGPSLLGHPISFEFVGPTLKGQQKEKSNLDFQWAVSEVDGHDVLTLDVVSSHSTSEDVVAPAFDTIEDIYGIDAVPTSGLYLTFIDLGPVGQDAGGGRDPLTPKGEHSTFEIFRVVDVGGSSLTLDSHKRLSTFFDVPEVEATIRAVALVRPKATRLIQLEQTVFAFLPPEVSAVGDEWPPAALWEAGGFDPGSAWGEDADRHQGAEEDYQRPFLLPNPMLTAPLIQGELFGEGVDVEYGRFWVKAPADRLPKADDVGKLLQIHTFEGSLLKDAPILGFYEIEAIDLTEGEERWMCRHGQYWDGVYKWADPHNKLGDGRVSLSIHDPINHLWTSPHVSRDAIEQARLAHLIDSKVGYSAKSPPSLAKADRAVFDTASSGSGYADPGSLLDLGFRVVLFPGVLRGGRWEPDFDKPIDTSEELVVNPSVEVGQWVHVDYTGGLLYLSHPAAEGGDLFPVGVTTPNTDNPRGEFVLFASCVPHSREQSQRGPHVRVLGQVGCDSDSMGDVYGERISIPLLDGEISSQGLSLPLERFVIRLSEEIGELPSEGWVSLRDGSGDPLFETEEASQFRYSGYRNVYNDSGSLRYGELLHVRGGEEGDPVVVSGEVPAVAVFRRDIKTSYAQDTTMGFAARARSIRFKGAAIERERDGSIQVDVSKDEMYGLFGSIFSSWVISGLSVEVGDDPYTVTIGEGVALVDGRRVEIPGRVWGSEEDLEDGSHYLYLDSSYGPCHVRVGVTSILPLPKPDDILLAGLDVDEGEVSVVDLRRPLSQIDQRQELTVGASEGFPLSNVAHFATLKAAIDYVGGVVSPDGSPAGPSWKIKVVGKTEETSSITLPSVNDVIIEGVGEEAISWSGNFPLFVVDGQEGWALRDLHFAFTGEETEGDPTEALLSLEGSATRFELSRLSLEGGHGLMYGDGGLIDSVIKQCDITVSDFGIYLTGGEVSGNTIESCHFFCGEKLTNLDTVACVWMPDGGEDNTLSSSHLVGSDYGVRLGGVRDHVADNTINNTRSVGVVLSDESVSVILRGNHIETHTEDAEVGAVKVGCLIEGADHIVAGNYVRLIDDIKVDLAVDAGGSTRGQLTGNYLFSSVVWGEDFRVSENFISGDAGSGVFGEGSMVNENLIEGDLIGSPGSTLQSNYVGGVINTATSVSNASIRVFDCMVFEEESVCVAGPFSFWRGNFIAGPCSLSLSVRMSGNFLTTLTAVGVVDSLHLDSNTITSNVTLSLVSGTLVANRFKNDITMTLEATVFMSNFARNATLNESERVLFVGNNIAQNAGLTGTALYVSSNLFDSLTLVGSSHHLIGNFGGEVGFDLTDSHFEGNILGNLNGGACTRNTFIGNQIQSLNEGSNGHNLIKGNRIGGLLSLGGLNESQNHIDGNIIEGNLVCGGSNCNIINNVLPTADCEISLAGTGAFVMGNRVNGTIDITKANATFIGNTVVDTVEITSGNGIIRGNRVNDLLMKGAGNEDIIEGNAVAGTLTSLGADSIVQTNRVGEDLIVFGARTAVHQNKVKGSLVLANFGYQAMGNYVFGVVESALGAGGADPDAVNGIFVGNRVIDEDATGTPFFGGAMPASAGGVKDNNV